MATPPLSNPEPRRPAPASAPGSNAILQQQLWLAKLLRDEALAEILCDNEEEGEDENNSHAEQPSAGRPSDEMSRSTESGRTSSITKKPNRSRRAAVAELMGYLSHAVPVRVRRLSRSKVGSAAEREDPSEQRDRRKAAELIDTLLTDSTTAAHLSPVSSPSPAAGGLDYADASHSYGTSGGATPPPSSLLSPGKAQQLLLAARIRVDALNGYEAGGGNGVGASTESGQGRWPGCMPPGYQHAHSTGACEDNSDSGSSGSAPTPPRRAKSVGSTLANRVFSLHGKRAGASRGKAAGWPVERASEATPGSLVEAASDNTPGTFHPPAPVAAQTSGATGAAGGNATKREGSCSGAPSEFEGVERESLMQRLSSVEEELQAERLRAAQISEAAAAADAAAEAAAVDLAQSLGASHAAKLLRVEAAHQEAISKASRAQAEAEAEAAAAEARVSELERRLSRLEEAEGRRLTVETAGRQSSSTPSSLPPASVAPETPGAASASTHGAYTPFAHSDSDPAMTPCSRWSQGSSESRLELDSRESSLRVTVASLSAEAASLRDGAERSSTTLRQASTSPRPPHVGGSNRASNQPTRSCCRGAAMPDLDPNSQLTHLAGDLIIRDGGGGQGSRDRGAGQCSHTD